MDTDREYEIALLEIYEANQRLIAEWKLEQLGKRAQRMMQNADMGRSADAAGEAAPGPATYDNTAPPAGG